MSGKKTENADIVSNSQWCFLRSWRICFQISKTALMRYNLRKQFQWIRARSLGEISRIQQGKIAAIPWEYIGGLKSNDSLTFEACSYLTK